MACMQQVAARSDGEAFQLGAPKQHIVKVQSLEQQPVNLARSADDA